VASTGFDLISELRGRIRQWHQDDSTSLAARLLVVILVPIRRDDASAPEREEAWAFFLGDAGKGDRMLDLRIRDIGQRIGLWTLTEGQVGLLLYPDTDMRGSDIGVDVLNVSTELTRAAAAALNGDELPATLHIAAVGAGALGSQTILHLARSGFGKWTLIDHDRLMPHNVARHALDGRFVGCNKAEALAFVANSIIGNETLFSGLPLDVLNPCGGGTSLSKILQEADTILDVSTSVAVARKLACDIDSSARRVSLFVTPSGLDLVLITEDKSRKYPLDALEMQYYRATLNAAELEGHFGEKQRHRRYGQSCRDVTSTLPQHLIALHAAIAAGALRAQLRGPDAAISVWRADGDGSVRRFAPAVSSVVRQRAGDWTVVTDDGLLEKLSHMRGQKLPNETGGVLLGSFDVERAILYIADALPSPLDSKEWPILYIRGREGLRQAVDQVQRTTHNMLEYVGEWHSHPPNISTTASHDDMEVFAWLADLMNPDGLPAVMLIVGDSGRTSCFVGEIQGEEHLLIGAVE
jgi:hypothetical protein